MLSINSSNRMKTMTDTRITARRNDLAFKSQGLNLAAHLCTPEGFDADGNYPATVFSIASGSIRR